MLPIGNTVSDNLNYTVPFVVSMPHYNEGIIVNSTEKNIFLGKFKEHCKNSMVMTPCFMREKYRSVVVLHWFPSIFLIYKSPQ